MSPPTLTLMPISRLASASKKARWSFQRMTCGPTSAASSARIKAMAILNSVVCTITPVQVSDPAPGSGRTKAYQSYIF